ncbi:MAG: lipopolysaccharide assembly LapA domain-containing protein [Pseudohongiellaceae bacterium]|jgi:uncharacterized integral membrane protein
MRKLANILSGLFLILVFLAAIIFAYYNTAPVGLTFGNWEFTARPISVWVIGAFVCGGAIGFLIGLGIFRSMRSAAESRRLKKELEQAKQEVRKLRALSLKDLD